MMIDTIRITKYLQDIKEAAFKIENLLKIKTEEELLSDEISRLALKYLVIEIAEAMANVLQHILAKYFGIAVKGYIDTVNKSQDKGIISNQTFTKIKPFFDFRNSLIHRYWVIEDRVFIKNLKEGYRDFFLFSDEILTFIKGIPAEK